MQTRPGKRETPSLPKDRSLEAYKAWIIEIASRLTTDKNKLNFTDAEWMQNWKEFWKQKARQ
jgi:hypothetical protein